MGVNKTAIGRFILRKISPKIEQTVHFNVGNIGSPTTATPGEFSPAAAAYFGQINIPTDVSIRTIHLHLLDGGDNSGELAVEIWRKRNGSFTSLGSVSVNDPSDDAFDALVPSDPDLLAGDYLFAQATSVGAVTGGNANGLTVDVHFAESSY